MLFPSQLKALSEVQQFLLKLHNDEVAAAVCCTQVDWLLLRNREYNMKTSRKALMIINIRSGERGED